MTEEERKHAEMLMAEMDAWKPGMPPPAHPLDEHMVYLRKSVKDVKRTVRRAQLLTAIWILAFIALVLLTVLPLLRR